MITFPCDQCEKPLEVDDDLAGRKVQCPFCRDVNIVPGGQPPPKTATAPTSTTSPSTSSPPPNRITSSTPPILISAPTPTSRPPSQPDRAAAAGYPPALGPEADVLSIRPAMARARPITFTTLWLIILGGIGGGIWFLAQRQAAWAGFAFAASGISVLILLVWKLMTLDAGLKITTKRTVERRGLLSRATSEVLHADIRNVQVEQTFWQRVWNVGTLSISCAAENEDEIRMTDVPKPDTVRRVIDLYRPL